MEIFINFVLRFTTYSVVHVIGIWKRQTRYLVISLRRSTKKRKGRGHLSCRANFQASAASCFLMLIEGGAEPPAK